ncbi:MAG: RES family NAD+ phosphorylase [Bdellovibrionaceae bacterium]|nr:RES family NAD+ phosphorylase [Pseudobdellovibrionaceae bacterium]
MSRSHPRKSSKSSKSKKSKGVTINAQSGTTGITHVFPDVEVFEKLAQDLESKATVDRTIRLAKSLNFWHWLIGRSITLQPTHVLNKPIFRICFNGYHPLDIAGSLAAGGRFNVGGAQVHNAFPVDMAACIYGADSQQCALDEVGKMTGSTEIYELTPTQPLMIWDLLAVINTLDNRSVITDSVKQIVDDSPMNGAWVLQKFPAVSQLLAHRLRAIGGSGLVYPSTKSKNGFVYAIFVTDNKDARLKFQARKV